MLNRRAILASPALLAACAIVPDPTGEADADMLGLLRSFAGLGSRPIETLTPELARRQPSLTDGVLKRLSDLGRPFAPRAVETRDLAIPAGDTSLKARLYTPRDSTRGNALLPLVVYLHGGGWVVADLETYDSSARGIAVESGAAVLSVHYRQGPEHRFPAAHDDAQTAWIWAASNAASLGADARRMSVVGESAGGNLAAHIGVSARDKGLPMPTMMGLIYPVAGTDNNTPSYQRYARAKPLNKAMMGWFLQNYLANPGQASDPRLNLYAGTNLRGLPPTVIVNAQIDPLQDDGARLEGAMRSAGSPVRRIVYPGVTHEFFGADAVLGQAREAQRMLGQELRASFASVPAQATPMAEDAAAPRGRRRPRVSAD
ncbi:MAG: alpha/beta hydrolase [Rubritepida sp.]|nr:alpha/beta hydrolase [Rubritepida sp.]